jgi:hypothetical protein
LVAVSTTVYVPGVVYWCVGFWEVDVPPSPNVQDHDVGEPLELSVNVTVRGAVPDVGEPVNDATGGGTELTVI